MRLSEDGLPVDARDWTAADWQDLHEAIEKVRCLVAERHRRARARQTNETASSSPPPLIQPPGGLPCG
jgi:hypothetical protein